MFTSYYKQIYVYLTEPIKHIPVYKIQVDILVFLGYAVSFNVYK